MRIIMSALAAVGACLSGCSPVPSTTSGSLGASGPPRRSLATIISEYPSQKERALRTAGEARLFRGKPTAYWRERIRHGDFEFGAWGGTLGIKEANGEEAVLSDEEWENGSITLLFVDLLDDEDPSVRWTAACGLGKYAHGPWQDVAVASLVVAAAEDKNDKVRTEAASSLERLGVPLEPEVESLIADVINRNPDKGSISYGDSSLTDADMEKIRGWTNLRGLSASGSEVGDAGLACVENLTGLVSLKLNGTRVTDAGLVHLSALQHLDFLDLSHTAVTDAGLAHLKGLPSLRTLDLSRTAVTDDGLESLKRSLPGLKVIR